MTPPAFSPSSLALWDELDHHKFRDEKAVVADNLARVPLDAAERALMQTHTRAGAHVLAQAWPWAASSAHWLPWARELALGHHERWDGQGYPDGLAGEAIPWPVRLLTLVDAYEALTAPRPYRPALTHAAATALIASERGRQFDPDVTDAFFDCSGDWPAVALRHA